MVEGAYTLRNFYLYLFVFFSSILHAVDQPPSYFTNSDIERIFHTYVKPYQTDEFAHRYEVLPLEKNHLPWRWEGKDFARIIPLLEFEQFVREYKLISSRALSLNSCNDPEWNLIPTQSIDHINYIDDIESYDLHNLNLSIYDYDFVMINNTLEHVYDPILCLKNIYKHLKSQGIIYLQVPVNSMPHDTPHHYYTGFTPTGLCVLLMSAGFRILHVGSWGNYEYLEKMYKTRNWPDYRELSKPGLNDFNHPISTWAFAIKD